MSINQPYREADVPFLAKTARIKSGATKTQAAREINVTVSLVDDAEATPGRIRGRARWTLFVASLVGAMILETGCCNPRGGVDTTPPGFLSLRAEYIRVTDGVSVGSESIPWTGFTKTNQIGRDRRLRLVASVGDSESGIAAIVAPLEETAWNCLNSDGTAQGHKLPFDGRSDEEHQGTLPGGAAVWNATFTVDPFEGNPLRLICGQTATQSAVTLSMRIEVRNGAGLTTSSGLLKFTWAGRPATP
jgi:hypothetical protein